MSFLKRAKRSLRGCSLRPSLQVISFEDEYCLDLLGFLLPLVLLDRWHKSPPGGEMPRWGLYYFEKALVLCWGLKSKFIYMPWMWDYCLHEVRRSDGAWVKAVYSWDDLPPDDREVQVLPYRYVCDSGEVQNIEATVHVERRTWWWRWGGWFKLPWPKLVRTSIDVRFSEEVGDRKGSWKGGCVGCGWDMLPGETMEQTLRRMEKDRRFR